MSLCHGGPPQGRLGILTSPKGLTPLSERDLRTLNSLVYSWAQFNLRKLLFLSSRKTTQEMDVSWVSLSLGRLGRSEGRMMMQETAGQAGKTVTCYSNRKFPSIPQLMGKRTKSHGASILWYPTGLSLARQPC